jgi:AMP-binding enzyme
MSTLPKLLIDRAATTPLKVAWRVFRLGVWNEYSWAAVHEEAALIGAGLATLGLAKGDVVAVLAENSVVSIATELGVQGLGCVAAMLSSDLAPSTVRSVLDLIKARVVVVGDQEQFDKVEAADLQALQGIVVLDARGFRQIEMSNRPDADRVLTIGQLKNRATSQADWDSSAAGVRGSDAAAILCTIDRAGGEVESHRYTHEVLLDHAAALEAASGANVTDVVSVQTSLADPIEHTLSVVGPLSLGLSVNIGQAELSTQAMRQVQPTLIAANVRWLGGAAAEVERKIATGRGLKGLAARKGLVPRPLLTTPLARRRLAPTKVVGIAAAVVGFLFLLVTTSMNDFLRLLVVAVIALCAGVVTIVNGSSAVGAARRGLGLGRTRAVVHGGSLGAETTPAVASLLGSLDVPAVVLAPAPGEILGRVRSEVLA